MPKADEPPVAVELKACPNPWCEAMERDGDYSPALRLHHHGTYRVVCTSCVMEGPLRSTKAEAIAAWNERAAPAVPQDVAEALHNLIVLARPHFSDETQMLALKQAEDALAAISQQPSPVAGRTIANISAGTREDDLDHAVLPTPSEGEDDVAREAQDEALRSFHYETFRAGVLYERDDWPSTDEEWADVDRGIQSEAVGEHYEGWAPETLDKLNAALARAGQDYDAIRAEAFREAAAVAKSRAAELRTIWGRQAAHLHENDAEMVARELDRQAKAILALAAAPQKGEG